MSTQGTTTAGSQERHRGSGKEDAGPQVTWVCHAPVARTWTGHFTSKPQGLHYGKVLDQMAPRVPLEFYHSALGHRSLVQEVIMNVIMTKMLTILILINEKQELTSVGACYMADTVLCVLHRVSYSALTSIP